MIDIHFHCLPGIDDGPRSFDEAVGLCRAAQADGVEKIVSTPHVLRETWLNEEQSHRDALRNELNRLLGGSPEVLPGCEYFFSLDAVELWERGSSGPLTGANGGSYLLVEFPALTVPREAEALFHELSILGVRPVIAHPERNLLFGREPDRLDALVERGAFTQVTAASITGEFGRAAYAVARGMFERRLVHVVASDAHSELKRPPRMSAARERVRRDYGEEVARGLFEENPRAMIEDVPLPFRW